mmetsp:Transcript_26280/g.72262  ORF Transcript_26280/g.72262 Transcript_26280/m.72262 type:complete len:156 (-) Transcript_26280:241-708(-)|eukprot:CAMPEP_0179048180 /NCGR_PEP_ID=MMETSP0796-20121207/19579_1 /TAXON_ID=73915 /ORGANISM="Pyrodinium bahamense, Strain pbaha01" /LENGTH=155 /DNA_ID=CAMNT_0020744647 /DNA_START=75 /DNA_END=542 /DNA_ORIENTATION=-
MAFAGALPCIVLLMALVEVSADANPCADADQTLKLIVGFAPDCFAACPEVCTPLGEAVTLYADSQGEDYLSAVCGHMDPFKCLANEDACSNLIVQARTLLGLNVPNTTQALDDTCDDYEKQLTTTTEEQKASSRSHGSMAAWGLLAAVALTAAAA